MTIIAKVVEVNGEETVVFEEVIEEAIEFRVYHDDSGKILFYTCEKPEGNYVIVDKTTFAEMRYDMKVVEGKLIRIIPGIMISKLKPSIKEGIDCAKEDVSIIVDENFVNKQKWKMTTYEVQ